MITGQDEGNILREEGLTMWNHSFASDYYSGPLEHVCLMLQCMYLTSFVYHDNTGLLFMCWVEMLGEILELGNG